MSLDDTVNYTAPHVLIMFLLTGVEVIHGDLEDKYSRLRALEDAYGCFCVTKFWPHMDQNRETKQVVLMFPI